ncbi:type II secretion system protein [Candidatus Parcubacteria bacterium]|nr:MAG: type II secretion system protein [Candidatus Parcubacteria bacterium]
MEYRRGFSTFELLVAIAIIVGVSVVFLFQFPAYTGANRVQKNSRALALALRKAQNMALAVQPVRTCNDELKTPLYFGVFVDRRTSPPTALIFADFTPSGAGDGRYMEEGDCPRDRNRDEIIERIPLDAGTIIPNIACPTTGPGVCDDIVNIAYEPPEARAKISDEASDVGQSAEITFGDVKTTLQRSIVIRATGQLFIR